MTTATVSANCYHRRTAAGVSVLVWSGDGQPDEAAFVYAVQVPPLAGFGTVRSARLTRAITRALTVWCGDRALPTARVEGATLFPAGAVVEWIEAEGRARLLRELGSKVVPFPTTPKP